MNILLKNSQYGYCGKTNKFVILKTLLLWLYNGKYLRYLIQSFILLLNKLIIQRINLKILSYCHFLIYVEITEVSPLASKVSGLDSEANEKITNSGLRDLGVWMLSRVKIRITQHKLGKAGGKQEAGKSHKSSL